MVNQFLAYLSYERNRSLATVSSYRKDLEAFQKFVQAQDSTLSWADVDADLVRDWMAEMMNEGQRATSINRRLSALRSFYRFALARNLVKSDPVQGVVGPKKDKPLPQFLKEKEMDELATDILKVFSLDDKSDTLSGNLPYGEQRKLEIARALATSPSLLLLDEPAAGMNPNETEELMKTIRQIRDMYNVTILLIEHDMKLVAGICEKLSVLNFGTELASGTPSEVLNNPEVITAYLGE